MENNSPNHFLPIIIFIILSMIYFFFKYKQGNKIIYFVMYGLSIILSQIFVNLSLTNTVCGANQWGETILITFVPWIMIFGSLNLIITKFPGWLKPFSNTFGYLVVSSKLKNAFNSILKDSKSSDNLEEIFNDSKNQNLLINEIPPTDNGFNNFINHLRNKKMLNSNINIDSEEVKTLKKIVSLKNIVSEFIWFVLTGVLTILTSYNYIINLKCSLTPEETKQNNIKGQQAVDSTQEEQYINSTTYKLD